MRSNRMHINWLMGMLLFALLFMPDRASAEYLKIDPPPDVNKMAPVTDLSCWLATAANMLAGAGYGTGETDQERAEEIYEELELHFSPAE